MRHLPKTGFLILLLLLAGVPGFASHLCAMSSGLHAHACCMGDSMSASVSAGSAARVETASCCKVAPLQSQPIQTLSPSTVSIDGIPAIQAISDAALILFVPPTRTDRGVPHLAPSLKSPVRALLCTFLL